MLDWASAVFNTSGPLATDGEEEEPDILTDLALRDDALHYLLSVDAQHLRPGSWSGALFQAVHAGKLELGEARAALSGLVVPSLDTTILSKANLLYNLGLNRHYWDMLRANPKLTPALFLRACVTAPSCAGFRGSPSGIMRSAASPHRLDPVSDPLRVGQSR